MKKIVALLCMLACVFSLTGCGATEETLSASTQNNITNATVTTTEFYLPFMENMYALDKGVDFLGEYNRHEVEAIFEMQGMYVDGNAFISGVNSFMSEYDNLGTIVSKGEPVVEAGDGEIFVSVELVGSNKTGKAEFIYTDDIFLKLESCVLNPEVNLSESMEKAGLNTLLGMGTVFIVLILISIIIAAFGIIPKIEATMKKKKEKATVKEDVIDNTIAQIVENEELSDDTELVAVIAAAIAAYEGNTTTDGFVVRSIRKSRR